MSSRLVMIICEGRNRERSVSEKSTLMEKGLKGNKSCPNVYCRNILILTRQIGTGHVENTFVTSPLQNSAD